MNAELISVGTELLMGQVLNTDAQYMAKELAPLGVDVFHQVTVGDNPGRLKESVRLALSRADIVILSGGLGPTGDDLTKETVAEAFGLSLVTDPDSLAALKRYFACLNREMTPNNLKQADFPEGAIILDNPNGTAPGCIVEQNSKAAILLPGPPRELFPMFKNHVIPYLEKKTGHRLYTREVRIFGMGESTVEYTLRDLMEQQKNPTIAPYAKTGEVTLRITAQCQTDEEGAALVTPVLDTLKSRLGDIVYSTNGVELPGVCADILTERDLTLSIAESCTGGMLTSALVDVPGSSEFLLEGAVTYSDSAKMHRLGVSAATLRIHGAVSEVCAREMAAGMRRSSCSDYAIATTGIAGPGGGTEKKPVGLVFIAVASETRVVSKTLHLNGDRQRIRTVTVLHALDLLRRELLGLEITTD
ncbi:MAG: competence/damage-inducible protein A [Eubacteriales bacterium]|nr:competence/damage-inducible protein A [Eubacteriales bacterium]